MNVKNYKKKIEKLKYEIDRSIAQRGIVGTAHSVIEKIINKILCLAPSKRCANRLHEERDLEFDEKYGVDTSGIIRLSDLNIKSDNAIFGVRYQAIRNIDFQQLLEPYCLSYEHFNFIDFGSGKGRAILLASKLPFKRIIGVEFSEDLTAVAKENLRRYPENSKMCNDIKLVCMDAAEYKLPIQPLVLYFYNPFGRPVMTHVAENVISSYKQQPRRIIVIYFTPDYSDIWDNISFLHRKIKTNGLCIYDSET